MNRLTGLTRYRLGWRKKIILQVGIWVSNSHPMIPPSRWDWVVSWRDATFRDVIDLSEGKISTEKPPPISPNPRPPRKYRDALTEVTEPVPQCQVAREERVNYTFINLTGCEEEQ